MPSPHDPYDSYDPYVIATAALDQMSAWYRTMAPALAEIELILLEAGLYPETVSEMIINQHLNLIGAPK